MKKNRPWTNEFIDEMRVINKSLDTIRIKYGVVSGISAGWLMGRFTLCVDLGDLVSVL